MRLSFLPLLIAGLLIGRGHSAAAQPQPAFPFQSTIAMAPEDAGDVYLARQQYVEAIDAYRRAPYDAATLNKMGVAWHHLSAVGQAEKDYELALALRPDFPDALNNLGAVYFSQKKYGQAVRLYRRALQIAPDSPVTAVNLGTAYFAEGRRSRGLDAYRVALSLDPSVLDFGSASIVGGPITDEDRAQQDYCIAELFAGMHDNDRALAYLRKAIDAGFRDEKRLSSDPAFAELRLAPGFVALFAEIHPN